MNHPAEISVQVRSNPLYLSGMREMVASVARRLQFSDAACGQLALAVDEALCNVIKHGYEKAHDKPIWISIYPIGGITTPEEMRRHGNPTDGIRIVIEDEARQVEPTQIKSRRLEDVRPGGLGVHIIQEVMDEVRYEKRPEKGMRLTMVKLRKDSPDDHAAGNAKSADRKAASGNAGGGAGGE